LVNQADVLEISIFGVGLAGHTLKWGWCSYTVEKKLKGKIKAEIIKRTLLNAYFAAVKLPMYVVKDGESSSPI
jgi:hypothetical protein